MSIRREIEVTRKGLPRPIDVTFGTNMIPLEFVITDFELPDGAKVEAYAIGVSKKLVKQSCEVSGNVISFTPEIGLFEEGKNILQLAASCDGKDLFSFYIPVICQKTMFYEGAQNLEEDPTFLGMVMQMKQDVGELSEETLPLLRLNGCIVCNGEEITLTVGTDVEVGQVIAFKYKKSKGYSVSARGTSIYDTVKQPVAEDGYSEDTFTVAEGYTTCKFTGAYFVVVPLGGTYDYNDLTNKPTIPTKTSQLTDDVGFAKQTDVSKLSEQKVDQSTFKAHTDNTTLHVTSAEKQVWNNKVDASQLPTITQEAGESESLVMSQKAVTKLVNDALAEAEKVEYETVDSVSEMTDKTKQYVLSSTGTVWTYTSKQEFVEHNAYDKNTAKFNYRINSSGNEASLNGALLTDYIEQEYDANCIVTIKGIEKLVLNYSSYFVIDFFDSSKTRIGAKTNGNYGGCTSSETDGTLPLVFGVFNPSTALSGIENTKYIRVKLGIATDSTAISASNCEGLVINFNTKDTYQEVAEWVDTEMLPQQATTNYVDLLNKINQNTSEISELEKQVTEISSGSGSLVIPTFWQASVDECIAKIKALQLGRNCVTFPFFSDNHQRNGYAGRLIAYVMKECGIPYCFFGGDSISSGTITDEATMIEQDRLFDLAMSYIPNGRMCRAVGNHDGYWYDGTNKYYYTDAQIYELFLREDSVPQNKHFGGDTYYYVEDIASKVRFVVLDTNDGTVEDEQIEWLQNIALSFNESGWGIVFISHQPISNHYHALISNATEIITIVKNYINGTSTNKADVIGWYSGHIHRDRMYTGIATNTEDDSQGTALGFTQVTITSDYTTIAYDDATKHTVAEDNQSHAIDFVTINKNTRTVNITRLGIGSDRSYTY